MVTLNTPSVFGAAQLSDKANERVRHFHIFATNDGVAPKGEFNKKHGPFIVGGEDPNFFGIPDGGEFSKKSLFGKPIGPTMGKASRKFSTADANILYKDAFKFKF